MSFPSIISVIFVIYAIELSKASDTSPWGYYVVDTWTHPLYSKLDANYNSEDASTACQSYGSELATVLDTTDIANLYTAAQDVSYDGTQKYQNATMWVGLHMSENIDRYSWKWIDGTTCLTTSLLHSPCTDLWTDSGFEGEGCSLVKYPNNNAVKYNLYPGNCTSESRYYACNSVGEFEYLGQDGCNNENDAYAYDLTMQECVNKCVSFGKDCVSIEYYPKRLDHANSQSLCQISKTCTYESGSFDGYTDTEIATYGELLFLQRISAFASSEDYVLSKNNFVYAGNVYCIGENLAGLSGYTMEQCWDACINDYDNCISVEYWYARSDPGGSLCQPSSTCTSATAVAYANQFGTGECMFFDRKQFNNNPTAIPTEDPTETASAKQVHFGGIDGIDYFNKKPKTPMNNNNYKLTITTDPMMLTLIGLLSVIMIANIAFICYRSCISNINSKITMHYSAAKTVDSDATTDVNDMDVNIDYDVNEE